MTIPYSRQWIDDQDINEVVKVLRSDWITTGKKIDEFEESLCRFIGCHFASVVNSGGSALDLAVQSLGIPKNMEVITTPFTFLASSAALLYNGIIPVFTDIESGTFNIDVEKIQEKITEKTRAILFVDYAGHPCDIDKLEKVAKENNLFLIEDSAHALGAEFNGTKVGNFADLTMFSFHPVKHITTGEGGALVTNNRELKQKIDMLRSYGVDKTPTERVSTYKFDMKYLGKNYRMTDFQAALGISQMKKLDRFLKRRIEIAKMYDEAFESNSLITPQQVKNNVKHAYHIYTILLDKSLSRDSIFASLKKSGIGVNVHFIPVYHHSYFKFLKINPRDFPVTEDVFSRILTIPLYPKMSDEDVQTVIQQVNNTVK